MPGTVTPTTTLRILIVDDNIDTAQILSWLLEAYGYEVRTAHNGTAAIAAARGSRPDAVLLDLGLPDIDGFDVARRLRALPGFEQTLLIASTGYSGEQHRCRAAEAGFDHYLIKPFDPAQLDHLLTARRLPEAIPA